MKPGDVVAGRFTLERTAGYGAMGAVFRAIDRLTNAPVALKVLHREGTKRNQRFEREANLLASLRHPGIVRYVHHGLTQNGAPYLAMEWIDGVTLADKVAESVLSVEDAIAVAAQLADALAEAHAHGVVHRDLKPGNALLVDGDVNRVKLIDFGIARRPASELTLTGVAIGSPGYMAPEQARGEKDVDARADVFSLGCILYRCIAGTPPFGGNDVRGVLAKILFEEPKPLLEMAPQVSPTLDRLVMRMLSKKPAFRPADGATVLAELAALGGPPASRPASTLPPAPSITGTEQRLVSVVLATNRIAEAEDMGDIPVNSLDAPTNVSPSGRSLLESVERTVAAFGARIEGLADGTLVATIAGQGNAADQAAQAARCALAMRSAAPRLAIVVATGRGVFSGQLPMGDVIDRATALLEDLDASASGVVELDDVTAALLDGRFEVIRRGGRPALLRDLGALEGVRTLLGKPTPCVGRERELTSLETAYADTIARPLARAVLVTAPAGGGKSRLRAEFVSRLRARGEAVDLWLARGDPIAAGSPFAMIAQALRRALGVFEAASAEEQQLRLAQVVRTTLNAPDRRRVTEFLGELLGLPAPEKESLELAAARDNPVLSGDQMARAFVDFLAAKCAERPLVLVLEDFQWGDVPSANLIDAALKNLEWAPFLVLALARPTVREVFPNLWTGCNVEELRLGPLTRKASEELVREVLGARARKDIVDGIIDRAGGNPFYLEELLRAVVEGRGDALPDTVLAMIEARLERLDPAARHVLRAASVFGQVFWRSGALSLLGGAISGADLDERLGELEDKELVIERDPSRFPGENEYTFRHALVRDAAYSTLTSEDRALGHHLAAAWLKQVGERDAGVLAEHLERGGKAHEAIDWYLLGAEQALEGNDLLAAIARADKGIACGAAGQTLGALHLTRAEAQRWRANNEEAERSAEVATETLRSGSSRWYGAAALLAVAALRRGHRERVVRIGESLVKEHPSDLTVNSRAKALAYVVVQLLAAGQLESAEPLLREIDQVNARPIVDPGVRGAIDEARAMRALCTGDVGRYLVLMRSAARAFDAAGDRRRACSARVNVGFASLELGSFEEATKALDRALDAANTLGLPQVGAVAKHNLGLALAHAGDLERARAVETEAVTAFVTQGDARMEGGARAHLARILLLSGTPDAAEREARLAIGVLASTPPSRAYAMAVLALALLAQNKIDGAFAAAQGGMDLLEALGGLEEGETLVRLAYAEALFASDRSPHHAIAAAAHRLRERASRIDFADMRRSFLERVPENARTIARAIEWGEPAAPPR